MARHAARVSATAWKNTTKRLYRVERTFSGRAALRRVHRFSTTPPRWAHRLESGAVWVQTYDAVGTSSIIYPRRGRALREAPSREASRRREAKFNLRRDAQPELACRAVDRSSPETADARSCDVARRGAARARAAGRLRALTNLTLTLGTKPAPEHAPTRRRAAPPRADLRTKRPFRYLRAASLAF